jgi:hypothetical protein
MGLYMGFAGFWVSILRIFNLITNSVPVAFLFKQVFELLTELFVAEFLLDAGHAFNIVPAAVV